MFRFLIVSVLSFGITFAPTAHTCTAFKFSSVPVVGKSFDWYLAHGFATVNFRGLKKTSILSDPSAASPASWTSRFASVTFNQIGYGFPMEGMNEKGLVAQILWLEDATYPPLDPNLPAVNETQWIQYMLDNAESVDEVLDHMRVVQLQGGVAPIHYFVCDPQKCATIEFIAGQVVIHTDEALPHAALANDTYQDSLLYAQEFEGLGGQKKIVNDGSSLNRFVTASSNLNHLDQFLDPIKFGFEILDQVATQGQVWRTMYQLTDGQIAFSTLKFQTFKTIDFKNLQLDCQGATRIVANLNATALNWEEWTAASNDTFIKASDYVPPQFHQDIRDYAESMESCTVYAQGN